MIFVFEVRAKPGVAPESYAAAWVEASEIIQRAEGALGTRLHRKIGDPSAMLAIASWTTKEARDAAEAERDPRVQAIFDAQSERVDIRIVGAYEDPEWVVEP